MAYNVKYILQYCNKDGEPLRIEIAQWDYIGQAFLLINNDSDKVSNVDGDVIVINIDGQYQAGRDENELSGTANPFILEYKTDKEGKEANIMTTTANMSFWADDLFNIDELQTSDETELKVNFWYNNKLEWTGFVVPDFFSEEVAKYREVALTASDRVGILKDIKYPIDYDTDSPVSKFSILDKCLKLTGLNLGYDILCDFTCDEWIQQEDLSAFHKTFVKEVRFEKSGNDSGNIEAYSCYEVIQTLMCEMNCIISQKMGRWCIQNKQQLEFGSGTVMYFSNLGIFESKESFVQPEIWYNEIDTGGQRTIIPVGAENTIELDLGNNVLYPMNYSFKGDLMNVNSWTQKNGFDYDLIENIPVEYNDQGSVIEYYRDSRDYLRVKQCEYVILSAPPSPDNLVTVLEDQGIGHLESEKFKVISNDGKKTSFDLTIKAVGKPNTAIRVMVILEFDDDVYKYAQLRSDGLFAFKKNSEDNDYTNISTGRNENVLGLVFENKYNNSNIAVEQEFKINVNVAPGADQTYLDLSKAKMFIRVYPNVSGGTSATPFYVSSIIKQVLLDFKSPNDTPKNVIYQSTVDGNFTKKMEASTVMFGDFIEFGKNGWFYQYRKDSNSIMYNANGDLTLNWSTINDASKEPLLLHSLRQKTKEIGRATNEYRIKFDIDSIDVSAIYRVRCTSEKRILVNNSQDELTENDGTFITANNGNYPNNERYIFVGGSIDYMRQEASMILIQCQDKEVETKEYIYTDFK